MSIKLIVAACLLVCSSHVVFVEDANSGDKLMNKMNSKMAQMKARMRAYEAEQAQASEDYYALSSFDTAGCDINIGNVVVDDGANSPDEIVILIDGDIIQSNNCH